MKQCTACLMEKLLVEFYKQTVNGKQYVRQPCIPCYSKVNRERIKNWRQRNPNYIGQYYRDNAERIRLRRLKQRYNLDAIAIHRLLINQQFLCPICEKDLDVPYVDHNHQTGIIRGLLHRECNTAIGLLEDNPQWLRNAVNYLERTDGKPG